MKFKQSDLGVSCWLEILINPKDVWNITMCNFFLVKVISGGKKFQDGGKTSVMPVEDI